MSLGYFALNGGPPTAAPGSYFRVHIKSVANNYDEWMGWLVESNGSITNEYSTGTVTIPYTGETGLRPPAGTDYEITMSNNANIYIRFVLCQRPDNCATESECGSTGYKLSNNTDAILSHAYDITLPPGASSKRSNYKIFDRPTYGTDCTGSGSNPSQNYQGYGNLAAIGYDFVGLDAICGPYTTNYSNGFQTVVPTGQKFFRKVQNNTNGQIFDNNKWDAPFLAPFTDGSCCGTPVITNQSSSLINRCSLDAVHLSIVATNSTTLSYQWFREGVAIVGATLADYYAEADGDYYCKVSSACNSVDSTIITVVSNSGPTITTPPMNYTGCGPTNLTIVASNVTTYQWYKGSQIIANSNSATLAVTQNGQYHCVVSNACGQATHPAVNVNFMLAPTIITQPEGPLPCSNQANVIEVVAGGGLLSYQWYKNNVLLPDETTSILSSSEPGNYYCTVSNDCGSVNSSIIEILPSLPPEITQEIQPYSGCDLTKTLTVAATGAIYYVWYKDGIVIPDSTTTSHTATSSGMYSVVAINGCGEETRPAVSVQLGKLPFIETQLAGFTGCADSYNLSAEIDYATSYQWKFNGTIIQGATSLQFIAVQSGTYTLVASNACGSSTTNSVVVSLSKKPTFNNTTLLTAYENAAYNAAINISEGVGPFTISNLVCPEWLTVTILNNQIKFQGVPIQAGSPPVNLTVSNSCGSTDLNLSLYIAVTCVGLTGGIITGPTRVLANQGHLYTLTQVLGSLPYTAVVSIPNGTILGEYTVDGEKKAEIALAATGLVTFTITNCSGTIVRTLNVEVMTANGNDDTITMATNTSQNINLASNDTLCSAGTTTFNLQSYPSYGTLANFNAATGLITYTPNLNFFGSDSFSYQILCDNELLDLVEVHITVNPPNGSVNITDVLGNAPQLEVTCGSAHIYKAALSSNLSQLNGNDVNYHWTLPDGLSSPNVNVESLSISFGETVMGSKTLLLTVDTPFGTYTKSVSINVVCASGSNLLLSTAVNTDVNGQLTNPTSNCTNIRYELDKLPVHGAVVGFNTTTGAFTYSPSSNFVGTDLFTCKIFCNNSLVSMATIQILVNLDNSKVKALCSAYVFIADLLKLDYKRAEVLNYLEEAFACAGIKCNPNDIPCGCHNAA